MDDTWLDTKPAGSLIPKVFVNESEAAAIDTAVSALMVVLTSLGLARPDREYLQHARWAEVVAASADAVAMLDGSST